MLRAFILIRPETESVTAHLASLLSSSLDQPKSPAQPLRILDLCTGTGCIPLLLHALLDRQGQKLQIHGIDNSPSAIALARENLEHNVRLGRLAASARQKVGFSEDDLFAESNKAWRNSTWDIIVSNPPYVSPASYNHATSRSVRNYEPKAALVPLSHGQTAIDDHTLGDLFYPRLLQIAHAAHARILLMEVADMAQATGVAKTTLRSSNWGGCEIWKDWPEVDCQVKSRSVAGQKVKVKGQGNGRAVLVWRKNNDLLTN